MEGTEAGMNPAARALVAVARRASEQVTMAARLRGMADELRPVIPFTEFVAAVVNPERGGDLDVELAVTTRPEGTGSMPAHVRAYLHHDPMIGRLARRPASPLRLSDFVPASRFGRDPFTAEHLRDDLNVRHLLHGAARTPDGALLVVSFQRAPGERDFNERERDLLAAATEDFARAAVGPCLRVALRRSGIDPIGVACFDARGKATLVDVSAAAALRRAREADPFARIGLDVGRLLAGEKPAPIELEVEEGAPLTIELLRTDERSGVAAVAVLRSASGLAPSVNRVFEKIRLTKREREVAALATSGLRNKDMGQVLGLGVDAVKWHLKNIFRKAGVQSRAELTTFLLTSGS